jgi:hypothetical protein
MQLWPLGHADQSPPQQAFRQVCSTQNKPRAQSPQFWHAWPSPSVPAGLQLGITDEPLTVGKHDSLAAQPDCVW